MSINYNQPAGATVTDFTVRECMAAAWDALLRGDLDERDRWVAMAEKAMSRPGLTLTDDPVPIGIQLEDH